LKPGLIAVGLKRERKEETMSVSVICISIYFACMFDVKYDRGIILLLIIGENL